MLFYNKIMQNVHFQQKAEPHLQLLLIYYSIICFQLPQFSDISVDFDNRFGDETNEVVQIDEVKIPSLHEILKLGRNENFSSLIPFHRTLAGLLIKIFLGNNNLKIL